MKIYGKFISLALPAILIVTTFSGCSNSKGLIKKDDTLMNEANNHYARDQFLEANEKYQKLVDEFPDSRHRKLSILGIADSLFKQNKFFEAALFYGRFKELYPMDYLAPKALFYQAMCHYNDTSTYDRNQSSAQKAVNIFNEFIKEYPDHLLKPYAEEKKAKMISLMRESEMSIIRFYHRTNRNQSAIMRISEFLEKNPYSKHIPEVLFILGDSYVHEQAYKKAAKAYMEIIEKYPNSMHYKLAIQMAKKLKLKN